MRQEIEIEVLVRIMAVSCFARWITVHKFFLEAGSSPVLGSSMYTTFNILENGILF